MWMSARTPSLERCFECWVESSKVVVSFYSRPQSLGLLRLLAMLESRPYNPKPIRQQSPTRTLIAKASPENLFLTGHAITVATIALCKEKILGNVQGNPLNLNHATSSDAEAVTPESALTKPLAKPLHTPPKATEDAEAFTHFHQIHYPVSPLPIPLP